MIRQLGKWGLILGVISVLVAAGVVLDSWRWLSSSVSFPAEQSLVVVERGDSISRLARRLGKDNILERPLVWTWYARLLEPAPIIAGEYKLDTVETGLSLLKKFQRGKVIQYKLTFIEGDSFVDFMAKLSANDKVTHLLVGLSLEQQMVKLNLNLSHPEGWFYPDTYLFKAGDSDVDILRRAHKKMLQELNVAWEGRDANLPYSSSYEALIMASIVEKETAVEYERSDISGVFVRRLQKGMRLQTDPTVIYGLGESFNGNLTRKHLKDKTPYNTYRIKGLPPTPIANPGAKSLYAATHPKKGDALYFVAKGDGTHQFSATLEQHNSAVAKYQRYRRAKNYRSTPSSSIQKPL